METQTLSVLPEFTSFGKIARLSRECIITEKIDGTNAQIFITDDLHMFVGSRNQWITPEKDNYGFAAWCRLHHDELMKLGPGRHFGEWWGAGIQRRYGLTEKRFSLFDVKRWCRHGAEPKIISNPDPRIQRLQDVMPACCGLVPELYRGEFNTTECDYWIDQLNLLGSFAAPGFMDPEGIVVTHVASGARFKKTIEGDEKPKQQASE